MTGPGFKGARSVRNGNLCKDAIIKCEGHMVNDKGVPCITGYHKLSDSCKDAIIKREGHMVNVEGVLCITEYHKLGNLRKDALVKREGHMVNDKGVLCITGYQKICKRANTARVEKCKAIALGEHHSQICMSAICQKGASITWEKGRPKIQHQCYDPEQSGLTGQKARKLKGLGLHVCKKCHRTAQECRGASCLASACRSYANISTRRLFRRSIINSNCLCSSSSRAVVRTGDYILLLFFSFFY